MTPRIHVFGPFELEQTGDVRVLRKHGIRLKIQGQPLDILSYMVARPAQVVSRQELQQLLWGGEVYVDFERGLNTAIKRLRAVLGDDPTEPRYIETVARTGYVFIATVNEVLPPAINAPPPPPPVESPAPSRRWLFASAAALLTAGAGAGAFIWRSRARDLQLRRLSFDEGTISNVFFNAAGDSVIYSAHWHGGARWQTHIHKVSESRPQTLPFDDFGIAAVSASDELLLFDFSHKRVSQGTIVRASLDGATPQFLDEHVLSVAWAADGRHLACVRFDGAEDRVEYPAGRTMHVSPGRLGPVRLAPTDAALAVLEHDLRGETGGYILLLERGRAPRRLMDRWPHLISIAWHPNGQEVWFTGSKDGTTTALWAADRAGNIRMVGLPGMADSTFDIHRNGRVVFIKSHARVESGLHLPGEPEPRELAHLGWTRAMSISNRGSHALFDESGDGVGNKCRAFLYTAATRQILDLGPGVALSIAPDASQALLLDPDHRDRLILVTFPDGKRIPLAPRGWNYDSAVLFPDGIRVAACARPSGRPGAPPVLIVHGLGEGAVTVLPFSERVSNVRVSPKGDAVVAGRGRIARWTNWDSRPEVTELEMPANLVGFAPDGRPVVRVVDSELGPEAKLAVVRADGTFENAPPMRVGPRDKKGVLRLSQVITSPDGKAAAYYTRRSQSELYLAEGLS